MALYAAVPMVEAQTAAATESARQYDIPAGALSTALGAWAAQSDKQLVFVPALVQGKTAPAISGQLTWREALQELLAGSGLEWNLVGQNIVAIRKAPPPPRTVSPEANSNAAPAKKPEAALKATTLKSVTVLGSLLPRSQVETASPLLVITGQEIKNRGFSSVADALQNLSINTGAFNKNSSTAGNGWGVKTISLFGLDPTYTKFLIDGRPMPFFSQSLKSANASTDTLFTNLSSIPIDLVERIEILPGGQSSLYGSDAIAGVVNIVLKKHDPFGTLDARVGAYPDGGGSERMVSASRSFDIGKLSLIVGAQLSDQQPMWFTQRPITAQTFGGGLSPAQAGQDVNVSGFSGTTYFPTQASDCSKLTGLFGGTERYYKNARGPYCGSVADRSYRVLVNKSRTANMSLHADYALNDNVQLYADLMDNYQEQFSVLSGSSFQDVIYDPNLQDNVFVTRNFAPEEMASSLNGLLRQRSYENSYSATIGAKWDIGAGWNLDAGFARSYEQDDYRQIGMLASGPNSYSYAVLGPQLGTGPLGFPIYEPNYSLLTNPLTPAQFADYLGAASIDSHDLNNQLRAQLSQTSLFPLPGGDAGLAVVAETGYESWTYSPAEALTNGALNGFTFNPGEGHRDRYATAAELNLPVTKMLTADLSARYDSYDAQGAHFSHPTWSAGLEFRPFDTLLLRGRYSTSFKAPTLIDEFEGGSTSQAYVTDYLNCARLGYKGSNVGNCPAQYALSVINQISTSNPNLQPMTAKNFSYGVVWSPTPGLSFNADYQHINIHNEVLLEDPGTMLLNELYCSDGTLDPSSSTCKAYDSQITRAPTTPGSPLAGRVLGVITTKINVAKEINNSISAGIKYRFDIGGYGTISASTNWTRILSHTQQQFQGDPLTDYLRSPGFSTEFRTKGNTEVSWMKGKWSVTLYGTYYGPTPNYQAQIDNSYGFANDGKVAPWRLYNASVSYSPAHAWQISLRVNNIKNSMPPFDFTQPSSTNTPYNTGNYNPLGREVLLEARYRFGLGSGT